MPTIRYRQVHAVIVHPLEFVVDGEIRQGDFGDVGEVLGEEFGDQGVRDLGEGFDLLGLY